MRRLLACNNPCVTCSALHLCSLPEPCELIRFHVKMSRLPAQQPQRPNTVFNRWRAAKHARSPPPVLCHRCIYCNRPCFHFVCEVSKMHMLRNVLLKVDPATVKTVAMSNNVVIQTRMRYCYRCLIKSHCHVGLLIVAKTAALVVPEEGRLSGMILPAVSTPLCTLLKHSLQAHCHKACRQASSIADLQQQAACTSVHHVTPHTTLSSTV